MTKCPCDNCIALAMCFSKTIEQILHCPLLLDFFYLKGYELSNSVNDVCTVTFDVYGDRDITFRIWDVPTSDDFFHLRVNTYQKRHSRYWDDVLINIKRDGS